MTSNLSHPKYRPDIDGLRAIAVLSVVIFHAFPSVMKGGFIGVDVFFVISGFLISTIIFKSLDRRAFKITDFYVRRVKRIFPGLLFVLISSYALGWYLLLADEYAQLGKHIASGAGFVSNFTLLGESGYFDNSAETKPLLHLWSLGIEEQFYIIWPVVLIVAWKIRFNFFIIALLLAAISFYLNIVGVASDATSTFYSPHTRFWELLCGSMLAWVTHYKGSALREMKIRIDAGISNRYSAVSNIQSAAGIAFLVLGFIFIDKEVGFPGKFAAVPVIGAVLLIAAGPEAWLNRVLMSNRLMVWIGLISFPLYLWHWPILTFARIVNGDVPDVSVRVAAVLLSIVLAWITYRFIERPIREGGDGNGKAYALVSAMVVMGAVGFTTYQKNGLEFRSLPQQVLANVGVVSGYKETMGIYGLGKCFIDYHQSAADLIKEQCVSAEGAGRRLVVYGDSEAAHLIAGIRKVYAGSELSIQQWTGTSCRPFAYIENSERRCTEFSDMFVKEMLPDLGSGDVLIVGANWLGSYLRIGQTQYEQELDQFFSDLGKARAKVVVFGNTPDFSVEPIKFVARKTAFSHAQQFMRSDDYLHSNLVIERLAKKYGLEYFNPSAVLCRHEAPLECLVYTGKSMTYFDRGHLSGAGSEIVVEGFAKQFELLDKPIEEISASAD